MARLPAAAALLLAGATITAVETITVNPAATRQTIEAWGSAWGAYAWAERPALRRHLIEEWVDGLGLTRTRIETQGGNLASGRGPGDILGGRAWECFNDDGDPAVTTTGMLNTAIVDDQVANYYLPFKQLVEARGDRFSSYLSASFFDGGSTGQAPSWLIGSPGEQAEFLLSNLLHLRNVHGITPDYTVIMNEPGNQSAFTPAVFAPVIRELGPRLRANGLPTMVQFAEGISAEATWSFINALQGDATVWPWVGMLSYHLYGNNDPYRASIRGFGNARGIPRAQTEYLAQDVNVLYDDLTLGEVSVWELYGFNPTYLPLSGHTWFSRSANYWNVRQVTRYVRPGSVRVDATSSSGSIRPLAFTRNGTATVVLWNNTGGPASTVDIAGLPPGSYAVCRTVNGVYQEVGVASASAGGVLSGVAVPGGSIVTVHPHAANQPPTMVDWNASPNLVKQPASSTTLNASAVDPELDAVAYAWTVVSKPAAATVALATPNAASTAVNGMTVAGDYVFAVTVSDPTHAFTRTVEVPVLAGNQAPEIYDCHNRLPVWVTLPSSGTTLRAKTFDLENDALTCLWTVRSQPAGAATVLANANTTSCTASGMTVAGDYVFRIAVSDAGHTTTQDLTVPVFPTNQAPVISAISASPASLTLPTSSTTLSATTSDPDANAIAPWRAGGDVLTHWWSVQSAPAGANPVFATPGSRTTTVGGLGVAGTYVFTVKAMDRTLVASQSVTVTVGAGSGTAPEIAVSRGGTVIADGASDGIAGLVAGTASPLTYQIANLGSANLTVGTPAIGGLVNCTATLATAPAATVAAGATTAMTVMVTPTAAGAWSCTVSAATNDSDENPTDWSPAGTATPATAPEIAISRSGSGIANRGLDSLTGLAVGTATTLVYQVANTGSAPLAVGTPVISGMANCTASLAMAPAAAVAAGGSTSLAVMVTPTASGAWSCTVTLTCNDGDEDPTSWGMAGVVPTSGTVVAVRGTGDGGACGAGAGLAILLPLAAGFLVGLRQRRRRDAP